MLQIIWLEFNRKQYINVWESRLKEKIPYICKKIIMKNDISIVNKKVNFEYYIINTYTAGIQLFPSEVKSIKNGKISLTDSYCFFNNNELFVKSIRISNNTKENSHEPIRDRKLLLKKKELNRITKELINGLVIVPLRVFMNDRGLIKVEVVIGKGKKLYDKRETIKKRDSDRSIKTELQ
jgi:SsrA-binding protein